MVNEVLQAYWPARLDPRFAEVVTVAGPKGFNCVFWKFSNATLNGKALVYPFSATVSVEICMDKPMGSDGQLEMRNIECQFDTRLPLMQFNSRACYQFDYSKL